MRPFRELVAELQNETKHAVSPPETADFMAHPARCAEAEIVDPCVRRFAAVEVDPTADMGVGRYAGVQKSVGHLFRKELRKLDDGAAGWARLHDGVAKAIAMGYLRMVVAEPGTEITFRADRTAEGIWPRWATEINAQGGVINQFGGGGALEATRASAAAILSDPVANQGLARRWKGKYDRVAWLLHDAGVQLRALQTSYTPDEAPARDVLARATNKWPFDQMPVV